MKLRDYLCEHDVTVKVFAERIGKSRAQVHRYLLGKNLTMDVIERIREATGGLVSPADFFAAAPAQSDEHPTETKDAA
jgi:transcriptional regulator with XRE-family HTH domain